MPADSTPFQLLVHSSQTSFTLYAHLLRCHPSILLLLAIAAHQRASRKPAGIMNNANSHYFRTRITDKQTATTVIDFRTIFQLYRKNIMGSTTEAWQHSCSTRSGSQEHLILHYRVESAHLDMPTSALRRSAGR